MLRWLTWNLIVGFHEYWPTGISEVLMFYARLVMEILTRCQEATPWPHRSLIRSCQSLNFVTL